MGWSVIISVSTPHPLGNVRFDPSRDKISPHELEFLVRGSFSRFKGQSFGSEGYGPGVNHWDQNEQN